MSVDAKLSVPPVVEAGAVSNELLHSNINRVMDYLQSQSKMFQVLEKRMDDDDMQRSHSSSSIASSDTSVSSSSSVDSMKQKATLNQMHVARQVVQQVRSQLSHSVSLSLDSVSTTSFISIFRSRALSLCLNCHPCFSVWNRFVICR
jgi:hypothetical protein